MFLSILSKFQLGHSVIHPFSINDAKHREGGEDWIYGHLHKLMNTVYTKGKTYVLHAIQIGSTISFMVLLSTKSGNGTNMKYVLPFVIRKGNFRFSELLMELK